ncbi:MAG: NHL repeat-containing protein [Planctomycetota bacterium]
MKSPPRSSLSKSLPILPLLLLSALLPSCSRDPTRASFIRGATVIGGPGRGEGYFHQPRAVEALPDRSVVVVDRSGRIQRFAADGDVLCSWLLPEWSQGQPIDLVRTPWDTLLVADTHYRRILEYALDGEEVGRIGEEQGLEVVRGIAVGKDDVIYLADYGAEDRIHRFGRDGRYLGAIGSRGDGPGQFLRPEGITVGEGGDIFVADCGHHRIIRFTPEGELVLTFGRFGSAPGEFRYPFDIARGSADTLYVVDFQGNRVQRFTPDGGLLGVAGGPGREPGRFATPRGVAVLPEEEGDLVFVADTNNHRVQRFRWKYDR